MILPTMPDLTKMQQDAADVSHGGPSDAGHARIAVLAVILLVAAALRVVYAIGLPMSGDEAGHLLLARQISLRPGEFHLPLDSPMSGHALGVVYVTAVADWALGDSLLGIRVVFIALHLFGLIGLYRLGATLFGHRVGLLALLLAAVDRHLTASAPIFLESPTVLVIAPWAILQMYRSVTRGALRDWLLTGLLFGVGIWISTLFVVMLLPFGLFILVTGHLKQVLAARSMYAGLALMFVIVLPLVVGDVFAGGSNYERNVDKLDVLGLSPRMAIVYVGDLLICLKDPTWILENVGGAVYSPIYVTVNWVIGVIYLVLTAYAFRYWRDRSVALLLSVFLGFLIPVTLIDARESWNELTWASTAVLASILLSAHVLNGVAVSAAGKVAPIVVVVASSAALLWFLAGPKWGYFCPESERYYLGQVLSIETAAKHDPTREMDVERIRELTDQVLERHPESVIGWYFRGFHAEDPMQRASAFRRALQLDPSNSTVITEQARDLMEAGDWDAARRLLEPLAAAEDRSLDVYRALAKVNLQLGDHEASNTYARKLLALKPESHLPYQLLYLNYSAMGQQTKANGALAVYLARYPLGEAAAYLELAQLCWLHGDAQSGEMFLKRSIQAGPQDANCHSGIAFLLISKLHDVQRANEHLRAAAELGSSNPVVYYNLGLSAEGEDQLAEAVRCYQHAIALEPDFGLAHLRLGWALADLNQPAAARRHLQIAQRLGVQVPQSQPQAPQSPAPRE